MTSIPLHCNICPKQPEFSDISHLLTHVASKGHLSQESKAKIRARQDASMREKLDAYDKWFELHQIEKLLFERMVAKDTKDCNGKPLTDKTNPPRSYSASIKENKPRRTRVKASQQPEQQDSPVKVEGAIDPQLSHKTAARPPANRFPAFLESSVSEDEKNTDDFLQAPVTTPQQKSPLPSLHLSDHEYSQRAYVPRMSQWQYTSSPHHALIMGTLSGSNMVRPPPHTPDSDPESDYFKTFLRSPTRTNYPDPSEVNGYRLGFPTGSESPAIKPDSIDSVHQEDESRCTSSKESSTPLQSPILKGVKWPGMSLFDSASLEAQRLRNQKKDTSVLEQMEHNSTSVEQIERIYWPDGSLKKQRVITGNVESSPTKDPTPPAKPQRRRRTKVDKGILRDVSTNVPMAGRRRKAREAAGSNPSKQSSNLHNVSQGAPPNAEPQTIYPQSLHTGFEPPGGKHCGEPRTSGLQNHGHKRAFQIYRDKSEDRDCKQPATDSNMVNRPSQNWHSHHGSKISSPFGLIAHHSAQQMSRSTTRTNCHGLPHEFELETSSSGRLNASIAKADSENIEPVLDSDGRIENTSGQANNERITQRYFSITGNGTPQFFSSMPPGMDFGSLHEPRYFGSTLNPLNANLRQQPFRAHPSQQPFNTVAISSSKNVDNTVHPKQKF